MQNAGRRVGVPWLDNAFEDQTSSLSRRKAMGVVRAGREVSGDPPIGRLQGLRLTVISGPEHKRRHSAAGMGSLPPPLVRISPPLACSCCGLTTKVLRRAVRSTRQCSKSVVITKLARETACHATSSPFAPVDDAIILFLRQALRQVRLGRSCAPSAIGQSTRACGHNGERHEQDRSRPSPP